MSSRISLTVVVLTIAIVLSAAVQQPGQAVLSAAQPGNVDPFGSGGDEPADKPGVVDPFDPFYKEPKASKPQRPPAESVDPFVSLFRWSIRLFFKQRPPGEPADPFAPTVPAAKPSQPTEAAEPAKTKTTKRVPTAKYRSMSLANRGAAEKRIDDALKSPTELDGIVDMPLQDVVDFLKDYHDIEIQIDHKVLDEAGIDPNVAITADLRNVSLGSALDLVLRQVDLTWTIHSGVLLITTPEQAETLLTTRVYDVADLVTFRDEKGDRWEDYDILTETITTTIARESWSDYGGLGAIDGCTFGTAKVITVSNTYRVHRQIVEFLGQLREIAAKKPGDGQPPMKRRLPPGGFGDSIIPVVGCPCGHGKSGQGGFGGGGLF